MATQKELLYQVLEVAQSYKVHGDKERMEISAHLVDMKDNQKDMSYKLRIINEKIIDPDIGLIVATNKNTEWRKLMTKEFRHLSSERTEQTRILDELKRWKGIMDKAMWILFATTIGILLKIVFLG